MTTRKGFTLIELLVVVAIIAVLIAILMPSLNNARTQAKSVQCMSNMKQLGSGFFMYAQENNDHIPLGWATLRLTSIINPGPGAVGDARSFCEGGVYNKPIGLGMLMPLLGYKDQINYASMRNNRPKYLVCPNALDIASQPNGAWASSTVYQNWTDYIYWRDGIDPTADSGAGNNSWAHFGQKLNFLADRNLAYCLAAGGYGVRYPGGHMDGSSFLFGDGHVEHLHRRQYTAYTTAAWGWFQNDTKWRR